MTVIKNSPFESKYGFKSPSFRVDDQGNITAASITLATADGDSGAASDFIVSENDTNTAFVIAGFVGDNPTITIKRTQTFVFEINTPNLTFTFYEGDGETLYTTGITHSDGSRGIDIRNKTDGFFTFRVPIDAPSDLMYRGVVPDTDQEVMGRIIIVDADGKFGELELTTPTNSTSTTTGALIVAGGIGVAQDITVGGKISASQIDLNGVGIPEVISSTNLILGAGNKIVVQIDGTNIGSIDTDGIGIPISNSTINDTTIGATTPSTAVFTSAVVDSLPTNGNELANKNYVDQSATALSIAFGL
jgi:hypothetical protein